MVVYGLVGTSGTGKSFRSQYLVDKYKIDLLIDDGLIIKNNKIIAGKSAKNEQNILDAVGTAIFENDAHRQEARHVLEKTQFRRLLVVGTSERMVNRICDTLYIQRPMKIINIEDISTPDEIAKAQKHRGRQGSHVIPVPALELKQTFPEQVAESLELLIKRGIGIFKKEKVYQKSLVRPVYSEKGHILISNQALLQIAEHCAHDIAPQIKVVNLKAHQLERQHHFEIYIAVPHSGINLTKVLPKLQDEIISSVQQFSGIMVRKLKIIIDTIIKDEK